MPDAPAWFADVVENARKRGRARVAALRVEFPGEHETDLGRRLVRSAATRAGWYGAATGTLALITLPIGLPAGIAVSLPLEAGLIFALLELYRLGTEGEGGGPPPCSLRGAAGGPPAPTRPA